MADYRGVLIVTEVNGDKLAPISAELLGAGKKLADSLGEGLFAALLGSGVEGMAKEAIAAGADKVFLVDDPLLKDYQTDTYVPAMEKVVKQVMPQIVLMGQTNVGRDLAPRLAFRLGTTATMDCIDLAIDPTSKRLLQTKPVYGGNAQAIYSSDINPQICTVRAKVMAPLAPDAAKQGEVVKIAAGLDPAAVKAKLLEKLAQKVEGIRLEDAATVVVGGRGMGGPEGFKQLEELAKILKGAVGASRPACDNNWIPDVCQIGLTGKVVSPDLYIAVALSGSSQHMSGCSGAKNIVAINKDPKANIIKYSRFAVIGDWKKVIPAFTAKLKELVAG